MFKEELAWEAANVEDLWLYDKLILAKKLGYTCGPIGVDVPHPGNYIVRPVTNLMGLGRGAEFVWIDEETDHLTLGHFWCEIFHGTHLSVDYVNGEQTLCVAGYRKMHAPLWRWSRWDKVDEMIPYPSVIGKTHPFVNCEFIGDNLIEVHLRGNPDFLHGGNTIIPVWDDQSTEPPDGMKFVEDKDFRRLGFFIGECS